MNNSQHPAASSKIKIDKKGNQKPDVTELSFETMETLSGGATSRTKWKTAVS